MLKTSRAILLAASAYLLALVAGYFLSIGRIQRHQIESAAFIACAAWVVCWWLFARQSSSVPAAAATATTAATARSFHSVFLWIGAAFVLYWRAVSVGLLSDDFVLADWARRRDFLLVGYPFVRPLPLVIWHFSLSAPFAAPLLHGLNIGLHGLNAALVYRIARSLGTSSAAALVCALMFLIWPTQVEAVVWTAGMFDVLSTTLMLAAIAVLLSHDLRRWTRMLCALMLGLSSLLTKESAVALFVLVGVLAMFNGGRTSRRDMILVAMVLAVCTACYMLWRIRLHLPLTGIAAITRYVIKEHLSRTFASLSVPLTSETVHALPSKGLLLSVASILFAAVSLVASQRFQCGHRVALFGVLWAVVVAAPTVGYLYIGDSLDGSRYLYMAAAGWALFVGSTYDTLREYRAIARTFIAVAAICFAILVLQQQQLVGSWRDAARERDHILQEADRSIRPERCGSAVFEGLPKTYGGAQLFNNGFSEAFASMSEPLNGNHACVMKWTNGRFALQ